MKKAAIRELYKQMRMEITGQQRAKSDDLMLIQFQQSGIEIPSLIMTYAPMLQMGEFDPQLITDYCYFKNPGQALFYPELHGFGKDMLVLSGCAIVSVLAASLLLARAWRRT